MTARLCLAFAIGLLSSAGSSSCKAVTNLVTSCSEDSDCSLDCRSPCCRTSPCDCDRAARNEDVENERDRDCEVKKADCGATCKHHEYVARCVDGTCTAVPSAIEDPGAAKTVPPAKKLEER